jgi:hypothetical protein
MVRWPSRTRAARSFADQDADPAALRRAQRERARREAGLAAAADDPDEAGAHERRAEKAAYLGDRLAEQERADADA